MSAKTEIISGSDPRWDDLLEPVTHDIYHTRRYHTAFSLGVRDSPGKSSENLALRDRTLDPDPGQAKAAPFLFSHERDGMRFLFPFLLRSLDDLPWCEGTGFTDVTSVYGYGGPLASENASSDFIVSAWNELFGTWESLRVISAFTRFHPLLRNHQLAENAADQVHGFCGEAISLRGATVSMDLRLPDEEQFAHYQKNLRNEVRKAYASGMEVSVVDVAANTDLFVELYGQTMKRRQASDSYLIDRDWMLRFRRALGSNCSMLLVQQNGETAAALLVMEYRGYAHAHLTGIAENFVAQSPLKPLLDSTRKWATARGNHSFHLGGGIGARQDSLFHFKRHFSPLVHPFHIGCWVLDPKIYRELSADLEMSGDEEDTARPFPAYRFAPLRAEPHMSCPAALSFDK